MEDEGIAAVNVASRLNSDPVGQHKNTAVMAFRIASDDPSACARGVLGRRQSARHKPAPDNTDR